MIKFSKKRIMEIGICLLVFLLPWQTRLIFHQGIINNNPSEYLTLSLYGTDILLMLLFFLATFTFCKKVLTAIYSFMTVRLKLAAFLFLLLNIFSIFWSADKLLAFERVGWIFLAIILAFVVAMITDKLRIIFWFIAGLMISSWLGIYQFIFQSSFANKWLGLAIHNPADGGTSIVELYSSNGSPIRWLRAYGSFDHPNVLGGAMAIGILLILWMLQRKDNAHWKIFFLYFSLVSMTGALFASLSRSAWAGLFLSLLLIVIFAITKKEQEILKTLAKPILSIGFIFAALICIYPSQFLMRSGGQGRLEQKSLDDRGLYLQQGIEIIKKNPILGTGAGNYIEALLQKTPQGDSWNYQPVHNVFLYIWAELGIVGLILFVTMLYFLAILAWRNGIFIFAITVSLVPSLLLDHWLWDLHFGILLLGFIAGLILL